jgi:hypothetical protein
MVIAMVALIVAVGGTSYAVTKLPKNSVGTAQLKNGAVTTAKVASGTSARIAGLTYKKLTISVPASTGGVVTVPAPSGLTAIGGGMESPHTLNTYLLDTHPTSNGWEVSVGNTSAAPESITVYAISAKVDGGAAKTAAVPSAKPQVRWFELSR